ncbi:Ig-like domain repeat protein [Streptomyces sp. P3]|uniref:Ig-like domain-containing protein n=1 Tax=unclassified Streptomyces TaxID=2593676 RepID=UPI000D1A43BF|nr:MULTISPECIES: Ig-like domain-containing protein [unclassified Streptomyces]AVV46648.1 Ig-like domain repeat protein [Streptomyces sp. P3]
MVVPAALAAAGAFASPAAAAEASTTSVQAAPSSAGTGELVHLTATVTCGAGPAGGLGVTFFDGATLLDTVPVAADGTAHYYATFTAPGTHSITGAYNGNDNCSASNGTAAVQVSASPTPPAGNGACFLLCAGALVNFSVGNINNNFGA